MTLCTRLVCAAAAIKQEINNKKKINKAPIMNIRNAAVKIN